MRTHFKIAFRNIFRNSRRSLMTISAISVGAISMVLFGEFINFIVLGFQTNAVDHGGHIALFKKGYFQFGSGNPTAYGIRDYSSVIAMIKDDAELKPLLNVVTPTVNFYGIAGNFEAETSKTFYGVGVLPADYEKMRVWDEYGFGVKSRVVPESGISDEDETRGMIGVGVARILGLCDALNENTDGSKKIEDCPPKPPAKKTASPSSEHIEDFSALVAQDLGTGTGSQQAQGGTAEKGFPRLDLLASTAAGAPNVVSFHVVKAVQQGVKELDDSFIGMHFKLAQQLLYGRGEHQAISIVIQLHRSEDMSKARARLEHLVKSRELDLEVKDLLELQPFYRQVIAMFGSIFGFIAAIMGVIVLFTVVNTMSMSVMERIQEIGTLRALGVKQQGIRSQFIAEGWILGVLGATLGLFLAAIIARIINHAGLTWQPPGQAAQVPLRVLTSRSELLNISVWLGLSFMATLASFIPANRAAKMKVVDALGHV